MQQALSCWGSFQHHPTSRPPSDRPVPAGPRDSSSNYGPQSRVVRLGNPRSDLCFVSPEDVILLKLRRLNESDAFDESQWEDILGVLAIQGQALDFGRLNEDATILGVEDLLERAIAEAQTYV